MYLVIVDGARAFGAARIELEVICGQRCTYQYDGARARELGKSCPTHGVPQGSILGPLLFLCFVNYRLNSIKCVMLQYADDSALIFSDKVILSEGQIIKSNICCFPRF